MVNKLEYKSTIKSMPFLYKETRKAASLVLQGFKEFEIINISLRENIFQVKTEARKKEIASITMKRLKVLDEYLLQKLVSGNVETSKHIVLYSIMKTDRLLFEFINEVYKDKCLLKEKYITDADFNVYFQRKREQSEKVANWNDYTFYKLRQVFIRIMYESGLIKNQKGDREITVPIIDMDLIQYLRDIGDTIYI
jgi:hypothetical protein